MSAFFYVKKRKTNKKKKKCCLIEKYNLDLSFNYNLNKTQMEKENTEVKKKAYGVLTEAVGGFIGRTIANAILSLVRAFFGALILAYPFKWIWNPVSQKIAKNNLLEINYGAAFGILFIVGLLFRRQITIKEQVKAEKDDLLEDEI